jgi:hypothetical protein
LNGFEAGIVASKLLFFLINVGRGVALQLQRALPQAKPG